VALLWDGEYGEHQLGRTMTKETKITILKLLDEIRTTDGFESAEIAHKILELWREDPIKEPDGTRKVWKQKHPNGCELEGPYECPTCGYHVMLDSSYTQQVSGRAYCPGCRQAMWIPKDHAWDYELSGTVVHLNDTRPTISLDIEMGENL
jgi:hypothetical protein